MRRARFAGGAITGKFGHSGAKYSKNPRIQHERSLEGFRLTRKVRSIENPVSSVQQLFRRKK